MHNFREQLEKQRQYYEAFKEWLVNKTDFVGCRDAERAEDLRGIDLFACLETGQSKKFQVKVDFRSDRTENIVAEIVSQSRYKGGAKMGWLFHLHNVDYLSYIAAPSGNISIYDPAALFEFVMENYWRFENFRAQNAGYRTLGVLIPQKDLESVCVQSGVIDDLVLFG